MQDLSVFNPTNYVQLIFGVIFYASLILTLFMSAAAIYVLIRRGEKQPLTFGVAIVYTIFFLTLIAQGINILNSI